MDISQPAARDVGINFCGADVGVAEQFLNDTQVCAVFQQMRGEAVSQHVGSDVAAHATLLHAISDAFPHGDRGEGCAARGQKDICG